MNIWACPLQMSPKQMMKPRKREQYVEDYGSSRGMFVGAEERHQVQRVTYDLGWPEKDQVVKGARHGTLGAGRETGFPRKKDHWVTGK